MKAMNTTKSLRRTIIAGYVSFFAVIGALGYWSAVANLNGALIAHATLVVESYSKRVQHTEGGLVAKILVRDGDRVEAGQDLVLLDTTDTKAELAILEALLDELLIKRARLEAQRDGVANLELPQDIRDRADDTKLSSIILGQQKLLSSTIESERGKAEQLNQQVGQLNEQIIGIVAQVESQKSQLSLIRQELTSLQKLKAKGLVPNSRVLSVEREEARLQGQQAELAASKASTEARIGEVKLRILQLEEDRRTEALTDLRDTEARIAELQQKRIASASRLSRTSIKAPITGTIYQLAIHTEGGVIGAGDTLMLIVPEGDNLVLQAQVSPNDVDQVVVGQTAQVRFPAFNARVTPEVTAHVTQIAADTARMDNNSPPFYAVKIEISAEELKSLGDHELKPGMQAEAFIQTDARTPLSYFLKPLMDQIAHAFRET
jgi:HlyD family secretion protein